MTTPTPPPAESLIQLANAWFARGQFPRAEQSFQRAIQADPHSHAAHFGLARIRLYTGDAEAALVHMQGALDAAPDNTKYQVFYDSVSEHLSQQSGEIQSASFESITPAKVDLPRKLNLKCAIIPAHHRSGWRFAIRGLKALHTPGSVRCDGFLENNFLFRDIESDRPQAVIDEMKKHGTANTFGSSRETDDSLPYQEPWVGFVHNPQNMPTHFEIYEQLSLQKMLSKRVWQESLESCAGLFCLSEYTAKWLRQKTGKPVSVVWHPTEVPDSQFDIQRFKDNTDRKIVHIGWWLRRLNAIQRLPIAKGNPLGYTKTWLMPRHNTQTLRGLLRQEQKIDGPTDERFLRNTREVSYLPNDEYDRLLTENIAFVELFDASANNVVVECIARATPLLVNPLPPVVEYLGEDYPFYFNDLEEAAAKALDIDLVERTHQYLIQCDMRSRLSAEAFAERVAATEVYESL